MKALAILLVICIPFVTCRRGTGARLAVHGCRTPQSGRVKELLELHPELADTSEETIRNVQTAIDAGTFPPIIHQSWKTHELPERFQNWAQTWRKTHPHWLYIMWSDEENRKLVEDYYPSMLETYDGFAENVARADTVRAMYMHRYGGVYSDLDSQPVRNLWPLLKGKRAVLAQMGDDASFEHSIPNAFMASTVGDQFWLHFLRQMVNNLKGGPKGGPETITGPVLLKSAYQKYTSVQDKAVDAVELLGPGVIYPIDWNKRDYESDEVKLRACDLGGRGTYQEGECRRLLRRLYPEAFTVHWWSHSWGG